MKQARVIALLWRRKKKDAVEKTQRQNRLDQSRGEVPTLAVME